MVSGAKAVARLSLSRAIKLCLLTLQPIRPQARHHCSEEIILLIRLREPALELCQLEPSKHRGRSRHQHVAWRVRRTKSAGRATSNWPIGPEPRTKSDNMLFTTITDGFLTYQGGTNERINAAGDRVTKVCLHSLPSLQCIETVGQGYVGFEWVGVIPERAVHKIYLISRESKVCKSNHFHRLRKRPVNA